MPDLSHLLRRFRRLGAPPGPPAVGIGVPERPGEALTFELQGVFAAVDAIESEARTVRSEAASDAKRLLAAQQAEGSRIRDDALERAVRERAAVAEARAQSAAGELARLAAEADREALRIADAARLRTDQLVATAVERALGA